VLNHIHWLGHDAFRVDGPRTVYFDPYEIGEGRPEADLILISHDHFDHCSPEDVESIQGASTVIVTIKAAAEKLSGTTRIVEPGDAITVRGIEVEAVPAYNVNKFRSPGEPFHPQDAGHVGFVVTMDGQRIYHAGDTDHIPEMGDLEAIDVALLPVSGVYVMTAEEAIEAARTIEPDVAVPMHVGRGIGSPDAAAAFKDGAPVDVVILEME